MHIFLTVLKVLLWILLILLGLILLLLLLLLFCPFSYRLAGEKTEEALWARIKVGWFIIRIKGRYDQSAGVDIKAKVLGIPVYKKKMLEPKPSEEPPQETGPAELPVPISEPVTAPAVQPEKPSQDKESLKEAKKAEKAEKKARKAAEKEEKKAEKEAGKASKKDPSEGNSPEEEMLLPDMILAKLDDVQTKADIFLDKIYDKTAQLNTKKNHLLQFLDKPYTKKTLRRVKKILKRLLGTIKPKKSRGWLHIGMKSAADTGELLGKLSRFYTLYGRWLTIEPDFYNKVMEGKLDIRGRIYLFRFLFPAIGLALSPSTWKTVKLAKKI